MKQYFNYYMPTKIIFGPGRLKELAELELPGKKALIVIGSGNSMRRLGYLDRVIGYLKDNNVEAVVFDKILPNPISEHVMEGAKVAKENNCDFVVGLGGGSSIDSAKSIAIMAKNPGDYWDYVIGGSGKGRPLQNGALPIVAITTTAGTGTEADPWTVITKSDTNEKIGFGCDDTFPYYP
jgi:alcohol dehydrogenase